MPRSADAIDPAALPSVDPDTLPAETGVAAPVSQEPPLVLWSVDKRSGSLDVWLGAPGSALHLLAGDQEPLAWR